MPVAQQAPYQLTTSTIPLSTPAKSPYYSRPVQRATYSRTPMPLPTAGSSANTSAVPSLTSGSYPGSATGGSESSNNGAGGVDLIDMMTDRLSSAVNPLPLDRSLAHQAQTSGELNAKHRELLELQALAQRRLKGTRANIADGMKAAKEVKRDLAWTQKRVSGLNAKAARKYPTAYKTASERYPAPVD